MSFSLRGQARFDLASSRSSQLTLRRRTLLNLRNDVFLKSLGLGYTAPSLHNLAITSDEELFEVPLHTLESHYARFRALHVLEDRLCFVPVDVCFSEDGKRDAVVELAEFLDVVVGARVLAVELVAWEAEDDELVGVFGRDLLPQLLEAF